jgi:hypothetical protein
MFAQNWHVFVAKFDIMIIAVNFKHDFNLYVKLRNTSSDFTSDYRHLFYSVVRHPEDSEKEDTKIVFSGKIATVLA